jgi:hypothetical protein
VAKLTPTSQDDVLVLATAVLDAVGEATDPVAPAGRFNIEIRGVFVGTAVLERAFNGQDFVPCTNMGEAVIFTAPTSELAQNYEANVLFRLRCLTLTSGSMIVRISQ